MKGFYISESYIGAHGRTISINPLPGKVCTFDCVFCPMDERTAEKTDKAAVFKETDDFIKKLDIAIQNENIEAVFVSAAGEALANIQINEIVEVIKKHNCKAVIISNGYMFGYMDFFTVLNRFDVVIGELMASTEADFQSLCRPVRGFTLQQHISNMEVFRKQYMGKFVLDITILKGYSDTDEAMDFFKAAVERLQPDEVEFETPDEGKLGKAFGVEEATLERFRMHIKP
ncbi:MAG: radical SAM protein [Bacillota bacterium]